MRKPLTYSSYIKLRDGSVIPFSTMSEEQKAPHIKKMMEHAGHVMSNFYAEHPELPV